MGLFGKIKENLEHGGVKLTLQVPSAVPSDQAIPVTVNITSDSPQTIVSLKAELRAQARQTGMSMGNLSGGIASGGMNVMENRTNYQTVAVVENHDSLVVNPGETKTVTLQLFLNSNNTGGNQMGMSGALGGVLNSLSGMGQTSYMYSVHAMAKVQGLTLEPSDKQSIELLPAGASTQPTQNSGAGQAPQPPTA